MSQHRTAQLAKLAGKLAAIRLSKSPNKQADYKRTLFYELKSMGGVYFKCLQIMSVTLKFLEGWAGPKEMSVFNQIPTEKIDIEKYINPDDFVRYERQPFATGSFAQVYKGQLKTGEIVAIKILRPSIATNLKRDLRYLKRLARLFAEFLPSTILDYKKAVWEFCQTCLKETDYTQEIANMKYFYSFYQGHPYVVIPKVYESLSSSQVIVQDYLEGPTFADALTARTAINPASKIIKEATGSDLWTQLITTGGEALRMSMQAEYVFGDPHPGNIKLLPHNKIAFIDFGIIANKPTSQTAFRDWVQAYHNVLDGSGSLEPLVITTLSCFCPDVATALDTCKTYDERSLLNIFAEAAKHKLDSLKDDSIINELARNGHFFRLFTDDSFNTNNAMNVKVDTNNFQLLKAMQSYLGSLTVLDDVETGDRFAPAMLAAMDYALKYAEVYGVKSDLPQRSRFTVSESYEFLLETMSSLAESDQFIFEYINGKMAIWTVISWGTWLSMLNIPTRPPL